MRLAAGAALLLGCAAAPASAQDETTSSPSGSADLAVNVGASPHRVRARQPVFFKVTVSNLGSGSETGATITLKLNGGLRGAKLISAPPDTVEQSCPSGGTGSSPPCTSTWVQPVCHASAQQLSCRYSDYEFAPAGPNANPLSIVVRAVTGTHARETGVATVAQASGDANAANNRAVQQIRVTHA